jgi:hypothetical protein
MDHRVSCELGWWCHVWGGGGSVSDLDSVILYQAF